MSIDNPLFMTVWNSQRKPIIQNVRLRLTPFAFQKNYSLNIFPMVQYKNEDERNREFDNAYEFATRGRKISLFRSMMAQNHKYVTCDWTDDQIYTWIGVFKSLKLATDAAAENLLDDDIAAVNLIDKLENISNKIAGCDLVLVILISTFLSFLFIN